MRFCQTSLVSAAERGAVPRATPPEAAAQSWATRKTQAERALEVIGGGVVYRAAMDRATILHVTHIEAEIDGDTFFPEIDEKLWELKSNADFESDAKHAYAYSFQVWEKRA